MVDADLRLFGNDGLGVERHSSAGKLQHSEIVGTVADGDDVRRRDAEPFRNVDECVDLGLLAEDRPGNVTVSLPFSSTRMLARFRRIRASLRWGR